MSSLGRSGRLLGAIFAIAALASCEAGTGGKAVTFSMTFVGSLTDGDAALDDFVNDEGWRITLDEAKIALGPVYLWENAPSVIARASPTPAAGLRRGFEALTDVLVPRAHAHAGDVFFSGGRVLGEMLSPFVFDVLGNAQTFDGLAGVQGNAQSMSVELAPASQQTGERLENAQARVSGTASRAGDAVRFVADFQYPGSQLDRTVNEIPFEAAVDDFGHVVIRIYPASFFRGATFESLAADESHPRDESGRLVLSADDQPFVQMRRGVQRQSAYQPAYTAP